MSINAILRAFTNVMPPKCFNCCCKDTENYCWLLHTKVDPDGKPDNCPLVVEEPLKKYRLQEGNYDGMGGTIPSVESEE